MSEQDEERERKRAQMNAAFTEFVPHNKALGMQFLDWSPGVALISLPYRADLVGDPESGMLHGGAISALLDAASGASVFLKMKVLMPVATLDLRIDYLKPGTPGRDVIARATCYKLTRHVAFVRGVAYHDEDDPIATSAGSFMVATKGGAAFDIKKKTEGAS